MAISLLLIASAHAQTTTASLTGSIVDPTGAAVPDAEITVSSPDTGFRRSASTDQSGNYSVALLPPGTYAIAVQKEGFRVAARSGMALLANQSARFDVSLEVGATTEAVQVTAEAPLVQQTNSTIRYAIDPRAVEALPLPNQNVLDTLITVPGVVGSPGSELPSITLGNIAPVAHAGEAFDPAEDMTKRSVGAYPRSDSARSRRS